MAAVPDTAFRRIPGHRRGGPAGAGPRHAHPGPAEPRVAGGVPGAAGAGVDDSGRVSPLTPDHVNRSALACAGRSGRRHRRSRVRSRRQAHRAAEVCPVSDGLDDLRVAGHVAALADPSDRDSPATSYPSGGPGRSPTRRPSRWAARTGRGDRHLRAGAPPRAAISVAPSGTGTHPGTGW